MKYKYLILLLMLVSAGLSFFVFSKQSIRLDEAQSLWQTSHSPSMMIRIVAEDVHVPLYHFMLHYWQKIFGNSAEAVRSLSLLFYVAIIPAIYWLGSRVYGRQAGLFAAILVSISPFLNWYGNEVRMYSVFTLLTIINSYFFISIFKKENWVEAQDKNGNNVVYVKGKIWLGYMITAVFGIFTHYFFTFNLVTHAVFYFSHRRQFAKGSFFGLSMTAALLFLLYVPWFRYVFSLGGANNTQPHLSAPSTVDIFNTFSQFLFGFQNNALNTILVSLWPLVVLMIFLAVQRHERVSPVTTFFFLNLVIPILLAYLVSATWKPIYLSRYLILALPSLYLLLSWMVSLYPRRLAMAVRTLLVFLMLTTLVVEIASAQTPVKEDYKAASDYLMRYAAAQDVVVVSAPFTIYPFIYYYKGPSEVETLPRWNRLQTGSIPSFDESKLPAEVDAIRANHQLVWVLLSYDQGYEEKIRMYFDTHFERVAAINFSSNLNLYAYRVEYNYTSSADFNFPIPRPAIVTR